MKSNKNMWLYIAVDIVAVLILIVAAIAVNSRIKAMEKQNGSPVGAQQSEQSVVPRSGASGDNSSPNNFDDGSSGNTDKKDDGMNFAKDTADSVDKTADFENEKIDDIAIGKNDDIVIEETADFEIKEIDDTIMARIYGKSYPKDYAIDKNALRYLRVKHVGFDGFDHSGEIIVNAAIAEDVLDIFKELYDIGYRIEKIRLIDEYDADDEKSMEDNNSSAFNYRFIAESEVLSNHALGLAIDINTLYNPYVYTRKDGSLFLQPVNSSEYVDRNSDNPYFIKKGDACYNIFIKHGFTWGGDWNTKKDYQHFEYKDTGR